MMKAEGGSLELVSGYGRLIFAVLIIAFMLFIFIAYINSNPEMGISLPSLFGGSGG